MRDGDGDVVSSTAAQPSNLEMEVGRWRDCWTGLDRTGLELLRSGLLLIAGGVEWRGTQAPASALHYLPEPVNLLQGVASVLGLGMAKGGWACTFTLHHQQQYSQAFLMIL